MYSIVTCFLHERVEIVLASVMKPSYKNIKNIQYSNFGITKLVNEMPRI